MGKILECANIDPSSGCQHVIRGESAEDVLKKAGEVPSGRRSRAT
jgi:hypothetical protein